MICESHSKKGLVTRAAKCIAAYALVTTVLNIPQLAKSQISVARDFRPIEFTSRAQCAINSSSPARSILILGDGADAGRLAFNLTAKSGFTVSENEALATYRKSVAATFKIVVEKLLDKSLPLISGPTADQSLQPLLHACDRQRGCAPLEKKLKEIWSTGMVNIGSRLSATSARVGCHKISQFGALHGHLNKDRPTRADLEEIATAFSTTATTPTSCDAETNSRERNFLLQLDIVSVNEKSFEKQGFDFWNSVKTYAAWAWRNSPEVKKSMGRFSSLFPGMALEEELLLVPNGCRSISLPKCDLQSLSLNSLRQLAMPPQVESGFERSAPDGPQSDLISRKARSVNDGFLQTQDADASAWVANFSNRFNEARWVSRNKLQNALRQGRVQEKISNETLVKDIEEDLSEYDATKNSALASQMFAVCLETRVLNDPMLKTLRPDFQSVIAAGQELMPDVPSAQSDLKIVVSAAQDLAKRLHPLCEKLEKSLFVSKSQNSTTYDWTYVPEWTRERLGVLEIEDAKLKASYAAAKLKGWPRPQTYLELSFPGRAAIEVCRSPLMCAQQTFKSYVDIYYVSTWAAALQNARNLKDSNIFNPYAELTACKVYDPWFTTEQANANLAQRLVMSAVLAPLPVPVFFENLKKRPEVVELKGTVEKNEAGETRLKFDPKFSTDPSTKNFFADLGPLTGAPCAVQYSNDTSSRFQVYGVSGVTLNYCSDGKTSSEETADDGTSERSRAKYSVCGGCTINATGIVSALSYAAPPGPVRFLFGAMRAFTLYADASKDSPNRPRTYTVNPEFVEQAFKDNSGNIPAKCTDSLSSGYRCFADTCAAHAASEFEKRSGLRVTTSNIRYDDEQESHPTESVRSGMVSITTAACETEIMARVRCEGASRNYQLIDEFAARSSSCQKIIRGMKARDL